MLRARIVTSATVGANIGGGLVLMVAPFVLIPLVVTGLIRWHHLLHAHHRVPD